MKCKCGKPAVAELWNLSPPAHSIGHCCQECIDYRDRASKVTVSVVIVLVILVVTLQSFLGGTV